MVENYYVYSNISLASFLTAMIFIILLAAYEIYDIEDKRPLPSKILKSIIVFFASMSAVSLIIFIWLFLIFK